MSSPSPLAAFCASRQAEQAAQMDSRAPEGEPNEPLHRGVRSDIQEISPTNGTAIHPG